MLSGVAMSELLEQAIAKLKNLPEREQDAIAAMILAELDGDQPRAEKQLRPFGLCAGEFTVPDDFDAPLPEDIFNATER